MMHYTELANRLERAYPQVGQVLGLQAIPKSSGFSGSTVLRCDTTTGPYACKSLASLPEANGLPFHHQVLIACEDPLRSVVTVPLRQPQGASWLWWNSQAWELATWRPGSADFNSNPNQLRLQNAIQCLAEFHGRLRRVWHGHGRSPTIDFRIRELTHWLADYRSLESAIRNAGHHPCQPRAAEIFELLEAQLRFWHHESFAWQSLTWRLQPVLRDFWHDHALFTQDELTGIIDVETIKNDLVSCDLARWLGSLRWPDLSLWPTALQQYERIHPLSPEERQVIAWLHGTGSVLGAINWLHWLFVDRRTFSVMADVMQRLDWLLAAMKMSVQVARVID
jgi:hypothetical protein